MAPASRAESQLNLNLSGLSPIVEPPSNSAKSPFGGPKSNGTGLAGLAGARIGAGSPLHDQTSRLFPKRTRELQSQPGISQSIWGPPTSGTSTPLFEIPESPLQDGFPDLIPLTDTGINSPARRGRAGTLPSRISPVGTNNGVTIPSLTSKTSRPTPSTSPFRPGSASVSENAFSGTTSNPSNSTLLSRLRAGSMPQRPNGISSSSGFGQHPFSTNWNSRARAATLTSISSAEDPGSPQQTSGRESFGDPGVRTLDYLGLAETPYSGADINGRVGADDLGSSVGMSAILANFNSRNSNRFRSFSVNTQPNQQHVTGVATYPIGESGAMTPSAAAALEAEYEAIQERVRKHNEDVQAYALNASAARPRARTAGIIETPQRVSLRRLGQQVSADNELEELDASFLSSGLNNGDLSKALYNLNLNETAFNSNDQASTTFDVSEEAHSQMSRSLWIGNIPNSTTVSSLDAIFSNYGSIESTRVLTHKNCGFVNFEHIQEAVRARQLLNGKELFPGAGPVRIGFAKAPSTSMTPVQTSHTQDLSSHQFEESVNNSSNNTGHGSSASADGRQNGLKDHTLNLSDVQSQILQFVREFGAQPADLSAIAANVENAAAYDQFENEIPPIPEPSLTRAFDAPRLRDIRKRIDNGACSSQEIEQIAIDMLPEVAELSSDYLGNTVVQKLFEFGSEQIKEQMLVCIAPHLAEIGIHKNGTWAAQKIIEVCKTESQTKMIVSHLRPYTVPLFLDQYGNYVLQCCLRFGAPYSDFIFESMLSNLWDISQGRFGARAMRACLESHHATKNQQRLLAAAIVLHSVQLATNTNGALLLTWLLDTCTAPRRRSVLAPLLAPHLVQLCTHKVAYLTVLKVVNQRNEPEARDLILQELFFSQGDVVLEQVLSDQTSGVTCIFKILTTPFVDDSMRPDVVRSVSNVLLRIKAQPNQGYKRLMDEVGLSSRPQTSQFSAPNQAAMNDRQKHMTQLNHSQYNNGFNSMMNSSRLDTNVNNNRTTSSDSFGYPSYGMNGYQPHQQNYTQVPFQPMTPQSQYQNYQSPVQRPGNTFMSNGYVGYNTPPVAVDAYRGMQNPSASPLPYGAQMSPMMNSGGFHHQQHQQSYTPQGSLFNYGNGGAAPPNYFFNSPVPAVNASGRGRRR